MKVDAYLSPGTILKARWIKELNIKPDSLNLTEEKAGKTVKLMGMGINVINKLHIRKKTFTNNVKVCLIYSQNYEAQPYLRKAKLNKNKNKRLSRKH